jgi:hypothetical protein
VKRVWAILLVLVNLASFSSFAESVTHQNHNAFFHCQHTRQKIERTKPCPCGCNKKKNSRMRMTSVDSSCDSDDVVAHAPQFEKLVSSPLAPELIQAQLAATQYLPASAEVLTSYYLSPPVPPG